MTAFGIIRHIFGIACAAGIIYGLYTLEAEYNFILRSMRKVDAFKEHLNFGMLQDLRIPILLVIAIFSLFLMEKIGAFLGARLGSKDHN